MTIRQALEQAARRRYERHYHSSLSNRRQHVIVDAVLALGIAISLVAALFITFIYQRSVSQQQIEVTMHTQSASITSGDTLAVAIDIHNRGKQGLKDAYLTIPATSGFVSDKERIDLGVIKSGDRKELTVQGVVIGDIGSASRVHAILHYRLNDLSEEHEKLVSQAVFISDSHLSLSVVLPQSLALSQTFPFTVTLRNNSATTRFTNIVVMPTVPPGFELVNSQPAADPATNHWSFDDVGTSQAVVITGNARLMTAISGDAKISFKAYAAPAGLLYLQAEQEMTLPVSTP